MNREMHETRRRILSRLVTHFGSVPRQQFKGSKKPLLRTGADALKAEDESAKMSISSIEPPHEPKDTDEQFLRKP